MQNQAKTYGEKKNMPTIEKIVVTLHRQTVRVATALGHRHPKSRAGHRAPPRLCQTVRDGSALSIVIPSVKRFSTAADLFDKPISLTSKNLSSDFRKTHSTLPSPYLRSTFAVASLYLRFYRAKLSVPKTGIHTLQPYPSVCRMKQDWML